jgi:hypothetical protein
LIGIHAVALKVKIGPDEVLILNAILAKVHLVPVIELGFKT